MLFDFYVYSNFRRFLDFLLTKIEIYLFLSNIKRFHETKPAKIRRMNSPLHSFKVYCNLTLTN